MEKKVYSLISQDGHTRYAATKVAALAAARCMALELKSSVSIWNMKKDTFVGVMEFPYYLRHLALELCDITFNAAL